MRRANHSGLAEITHDFYTVFSVHPPSITNGDDVVHAVSTRETGGAGRGGIWLLSLDLRVHGALFRPSTASFSPPLLREGAKSTPVIWAPPGLSAWGSSQFYFEFLAGSAPGFLVQADFCLS